MNELTPRQALGNAGELFVSSRLDCPICNAETPHVQLPRNTPCVDLVCSACRTESQVKSITLRSGFKLPTTILGGSWAAKKRHLEHKGYAPYFFVFFSGSEVSSVYYLSAGQQSHAIFKIRQPLTSKAKSPGWVGYELKPRLWAEKLSCIWGQDFTTPICLDKKI